MSNIAVVGAGNIGGTLARKWKAAGHHITIGARNPQDAETQALARDQGFAVADVAAAVRTAEVVLLAIPGKAVAPFAEGVGALAGKLVVDATNMAGPPGQPLGFEALTRTGADVVKAFNCTGWENLDNPVYPDGTADMFMAGGSETGRATVRSLARDAGFATCHDLGGNDKVHILESFALLWIDLAIMQGMGRGIAFTLLTR